MWGSCISQLSMTNKIDPTFCNILGFKDHQALYDALVEIHYILGTYSYNKSWLFVGLGNPDAFFLHFLVAFWCTLDQNRRSSSDYFWEVKWIYLKATKPLLPECPHRQIIRGSWKIFQPYNRSKPTSTTPFFSKEVAKSVIKALLTSTQLPQGATYVV